jgi:hypothetical protein
MGMAAFRVNDEERRAREAGAAEQVAECPMPTPEAAPEPEAEAPKATTVTAKKTTAKG